MHLRPRSRRLAATALMASLLLAVATLMSTPAGAATAQNTSYARAIYADLLDRLDPTADQSGVAYWAGQLDQHVSRSTVVQDIQRGSSEYYGHILDISYQLFLQRAADPSGRAFFAQQLRSRQASEETVIGSLAGSAEFSASSGGTNAGFVDAVYFDVLGRQPTADEQTVAAAALAAESRASFTTQLASASEAHAARVSTDYMGFLARSPGTGERDYWVGRLAQGLRVEDFDNAVLSSPEYYGANSTPRSATTSRRTLACPGRGLAGALLCGTRTHAAPG